MICTVGYPECTGLGEIMIDPYVYELYGEDEEIIICEECYYALIEEI